MTQKEYDNKTKAMRAEITRAKNKQKKVQSLEEKIQWNTEIKRLRENLRQHFLHYFELVEGE